MALQQLHTPLVRHLHVLFNIYKASVERKPDRDISSIEDLFDTHFYQQLKFFDLTAPGPAPPQRWLEYLSLEARRLRGDLGRIVDKYAVYLDPDTLDIAEQLSTSFFLFLLESVDSLPESRKDIGAFLRSMSEKMVREHTSPFTRLVEIYNAEAPEDRQALLDQYPADNPWLYPWHSPCGMGYRQVLT